MSERHREAGAASYKGHRRRQLEALGIDPDRAVEQVFGDD